MVAIGYLLFLNTSIMHTAAKETPEMQKKAINPKVIHGTTRMTTWGGFGTPSVAMINAAGGTIHDGVS